MKGSCSGSEKDSMSDVDSDDESEVDIMGGDVEGNMLCWNWIFAELFNLHEYEESNLAILSIKALP